MATPANARALSSTKFSVPATYAISAVCDGALLYCAGAYLHDSQVKKPARAAEDMDMAAELWRETERQLAEAEKKLSS